VERLRGMLQALVDGWQREGGPVLSLHVDIDAAAPAALPQPVALAFYRISQEALTNVARHAQATRAELSLRVAAGPPGAGTIEWQACDNGIGIAEPAAALQRGNGLAGIKQRVWALGGDLAIGAARAGTPSPGLRLRATIVLDAPGDSAAAPARLDTEGHRT
jgi:two-component system, NarL family, sensor histidine kinase UhpB